jgi:hypothetical protein
MAGARSEGHLRFVCISDTHSMHSFIKDMPAGDVCRATTSILASASFLT